MSSVQDKIQSRQAARQPKRVPLRVATHSDITRFDVAERAEETSTEVVPAPYFEVKPMVDWAITAALLIVALPIMALVGLAVLLCDGRPVFYRQTRVGKHGRLFRIWKFRTMQPDAERRTGAVWSCRADPRVTTLGLWLRSAHLDELPQLFNVLAGDMNLIGPRPERPEFVRELEQQLPWYSQRIKVAPGITGLAQIRTGYDHCVADVSKKVEIDLEYLRSASFWADMLLLAQTCVYIMRHVWETRIRVSNNMDSEKTSTQEGVAVAALVGPIGVVTSAGMGSTVARAAALPNTFTLANDGTFSLDRITELVQDIEECA